MEGLSHWIFSTQSASQVINIENLNALIGAGVDSGVPHALRSFTIGESKVGCLYAVNAMVSTIGIQVMLFWQPESHEMRMSKFPWQLQTRPSNQLGQ